MGNTFYRRLRNNLSRPRKGTCHRRERLAKSFIGMYRTILEVADRLWLMADFASSFVKVVITLPRNSEALNSCGLQSKQEPSRCINMGALGHI